MLVSSAHISRRQQSAGMRQEAAGRLNYTKSQPNKLNFKLAIENPQCSRLLQGKSLEKEKNLEGWLGWGSFSPGNKEEAVTGAVSLPK